MDFQIFQISVTQVAKYLETSGSFEGEAWEVSTGGRFWQLPCQGAYWRAALLALGKDAACCSNKQIPAGKLT